MTKIEKLKALCDAATQGEWELSEPEISMMTNEEMFQVMGISWVSDYEHWGFTKPDAAFIAAMNPVEVDKMLKVMELVENIIPKLLNGQSHRVELNALEAAYNEWSKET